LEHVLRYIISIVRKEGESICHAEKAHLHKEAAHKKELRHPRAKIANPILPYLR